MEEEEKYREGERKEGGEGKIEAGGSFIRIVKKILIVGCHVRFTTIPFNLFLKKNYRGEKREWGGG